MGCGDSSVTFIEQHQNTNTPEAGNLSRNHKSKPKHKGNRDVDQLSHVDHVTTKANSFQGESQLYIFENNGAVINMIIKGRSPTMRHVSRTHRVALEWLFDRINLDPKTHIKYVDTKKTQLADMLTKGNFTCDEWNHFLHLFNISNSSSASCPKTMSKRMYQEKREERIVAKSKPTLNLVSQAVASSSTAPSSSASNRPGILKASSQSFSLIASVGRLAAEESNYNDAASSSQVWQSDAKTNDSARRLASTGTNQNLGFQDREWRLAAKNSDIIDDDTEWPNNYSIFRAYVPHLEKVYSNLRQKLGRKPGDKMEYLDVNSLIWRMFMSVTLNAAVHLGKDYLENLHSAKNQPQQTVKRLFDVTNKLITDQKKKFKVFR